MSVRFALRDATRAAHDRLDGLMQAFDLGRADHYGRFLAAQAAAFVPVEAALSAAGAANFVPDFDALTRADALLADLDALALPAPPQEPTPDFRDPAALAGGLYVLEGSRLGAATLFPQVGSGLPRAFLSRLQPSGRWQQIVAALERMVQSDVDRTSAVGAALATFDCFERGARKVVGQ